MAGPWERYAPQDTTDTPKGPWEKYAPPTVTQTPEQATDAMSAPDKFTRAGVKGLTSGASGLVNTLGKVVEGADPKKLAKLQQLIGAVEERMGVDPTQYKPASEVTGDPNRPFMERLASAPRSVVEMAGPAIVGGAVGGIPGAVGLTTASTAGPTIDRKREALGLTPDQELPSKAKYEVGTKLALDAALLAGGGKFTKSLMGPIESTGVKALGEAGKRAAQATLVDAGLGADAAASDKVLVEGKFPTASDLAIGAAQGALPGLVAHAPGVAGRVPGAARDAAVTARFKPLESLDPQSRGDVANLLNRYDGSFTSVNERLGKDLTSASKGLDDSTKALITDARIKLKNGQRLDPEDIQTVSSASPQAAKVLKNLDSFSVMKELNNGGLSGSALGRVLNPFQRGASADPATTIGRFAEGASIGHAFWSHDPATAAMVLGGQAAGTGLLHGIDRFTGAYDPAKVITDKYATGSTSSSPLAEAKATVKINKKTNSADGVPEIHTVSVDGMEVSQKKDTVRDAGRFNVGVEKRVKPRNAAINEMLGVVSSDEAKGLLNSLKNDWTHNSPDLKTAKEHFSDVLSDPSLSPEEVKALQDIYKKHDFEWTWPKKRKA